MLDDNMNKLIINTLIYAVIINLLLSVVVGGFATPAEISPPGGMAGKLPFKGQMMHLFAHHQQILPASSLMMIIMVYLIVMMAIKYPILKK